MAISMPRIVRSKHSTGQISDIAKGYTAVYVGNEKRRYRIPICYRNQALFQELLSEAEEEFRFDHPAGGLTLPCTENVFINVISRLNQS